MTSKSKSNIDPFTKMFFQLLFSPITYNIKKKNKDIKIKTNKKVLGNETILKI